VQDHTRAHQTSKMQCQKAQENLQKKQDEMTLNLIGENKSTTKTHPIKEQMKALLQTKS